MKYKQFLLLTIFVSFLAGASLASAQTRDEITDINRTANFLGLTKPTPIAITGFSGEVANVLKYDLAVMGFIAVTPDAAGWALSGSNNGNIQAQLNSGKTLSFAKSYNGASLRAQAHRLADDVVLKITGVNGIAETKIAFKVQNGRDSEIFISDFDGHNPMQVTRDGSSVAAPCWMPGRLALYYSSYKLGPLDIFYQNLSTGERRNFSHYPGMNSSAAVSPDGRRVSMILSKSGSPDVYVCDAGGGDLKQLTDTPEDESSPCWSPDGQWICYAAKMSERRSLYRVPANGGALQRIHTDGISSPSEPDWSPDGKWIAFTSQYAGGFNICVIPAQGGGATVLVSGEDPSWAPNSRTLVFTQRRGENRVLSLLDVPTKQVKDVSRVSGSNSSNSQPSWAR